MSKRYKGAILSSTPPTTSTSSASGVWTEQQFMQGVASGSWPALAGAPTIGTATAGALSASVTFTAPTYTGSGITGYTVTSNPGGITGTGASSPITVSGLTAGTAYTFTVTATTAAGQSSASAASNSVTPTQLYIEDVYSTYLYTGNGSTQTITNSIDLSTYGGLTWVKPRSVADWHNLYDTARGASKSLATNATDAQYDLAGNGVSAFGSTGFTVNGSNDQYNTSGQTYASWTFREQAKFFDVVTYTGNDTAGRTIAHNLGSVPGCIIVKATNSTLNWFVYHRSLGNTKSINLNLTSAATTVDNWGNTTPTSTVFTVDSGSETNQSGVTYVAYLFAHDAGGFGLTGTDNVISCGSYTGNGSATGPVITLGYEPQFVMIKNTTAAGNWVMLDVMRGLPVGDGDAVLYANVTDAETSLNYVNPLSTGFQLTASATYVNTSGSNYIYIAIRRGPMAVPTLGTSVFSPVLQSGGGTVTTNFSVDSTIAKLPSSGTNNIEITDRLRGASTNFYNVLRTASTGAEISGSGAGFGYDNNLGFIDTYYGSGNQIIYWNFRRAPSFFDEVCYTGTGTAGQTFNHNLGVAPELMIVKNRSNTTGVQWCVYAASQGATNFQWLNTTNAFSAGSTYWNDTAPTSSVFSVGTNFRVNNSGNTFVAYLFATCAGVSKVGSYTGTGATQTISCGFTGGARFVLVKRTDSTGDWYVWDTARGMVSGTDPSLLLNSTAAEVNANSIYTTTGGFQIVSTAAGINASGGTYIFLAIA